MEFSGGAVDFNPNESSSKNSGGPVDNIPVEKVAAEDVHFHASDISNRDSKDFFDNPAEKKRREKAEQKRIKAEAKRVLKESKANKATAGGASSEVAAHEEALKREQRKIGSEHRQARARASFGRVAKYWYIYVGAIAAVAIAVCAIIFVPKIIQGIADANNSKYIEENRTPILRLFAEMAGKRLSKDEIASLVAKYDDTLVVDYYPQAGIIHAAQTRLETITMSPVENEDGEYSFFRYENRSGEKDVYISANRGGYSYCRGENEKQYSKIEDAIDAYILDAKEDR